jgi:hypothetical protein
MAERLMQYLEKVVDECGFEAAVQDPRTSDVASALCLVRTGIEFDEHDLAEQLGDVADFYGLDPDEMQAILHQHEPTLSKEWIS